MFQHPETKEHAEALRSTPSGGFDAALALVNLALDATAIKQQLRLLRSETEKYEAAKAESVAARETHERSVKETTAALDKRKRELDEREIRLIGEAESLREQRKRLPLPPNRDIPFNNGTTGGQAYFPDPVPAADDLHFGEAPNPVGDGLEPAGGASEEIPEAMDGLTLRRPGKAVRVRPASRAASGA